MVEEVFFCFFLGAVFFVFLVRAGSSPLKRVFVPDFVWLRVMAIVMVLGIPCYCAILRDYCVGSREA